MRGKILTRWVVAIFQGQQPPERQNPFFRVPLEESTKKKSFTIKLNVIN